MLRQGASEPILMRNLREQRINRGRFQGFRRPPNMWAKGGHSQRTRVKAPARVAEKEEQAFEASVSI